MSRGNQFSITRTIEIDAAHRVPDHKSKCFNLHGHRYVIDATVQGPTIKFGEQRGMVMDFGFLKDCMMSAIHANCDHGTILCGSDPMLATIFGTKTRNFCFGEATTWEDLPGWKLYIIHEVPTAENLAMIWFKDLKDEIEHYFITCFPGVDPPTLLDVSVWETPNCVARYPS